MSWKLHRTLAAVVGAAMAFAATPALADGFRENPLARFEEPVCPGIIGLQSDFAMAVVARIRENADRFGVRTADPENCEANLIVSFLSDGQSYLQRLNQSRGHMFEALSGAERRELLSQTGPTRAWITTETRTRDGMQMGRRENLVNIPQAAMWSAHSLIYVPTRRDITAAMVLIDRGAIDGMSVNQVADYATLYGFADFVPEASADVATIQNLFAGGDATNLAGLTEFDAAYLERLYDSIPNLPAYVRLEGLEGIAALEE